MLYSPTTIRQVIFVPANGSRTFMPLFSRFSFNPLLGKRENVQKPGSREETRYPLSALGHPMEPSVLLVLRPQDHLPPWDLRIPVINLPPPDDSRSPHLPPVPHPRGCAQPVAELTR